MVRYLALGFMFAAVGISGCSESNGGTSSQASTQSGSSAPGSVSTTVAYTVVSAGGEAGITNPQLQVITDSEHYSALLSITSLSGVIPNINFSTSELIGVFLGRNVGCGVDALSIKDVEESEKTITVYASRQANIPDHSVCTLMLPYYSYSYAFVEIPATDKPISLVYE